MMCVEVTLNGDRQAVAGDADAEVINVHLSLYPALGEAWLDVTGTVSRGEQPAAEARWLSKAINAGDALQYRLTEVTVPSPATMLRTIPTSAASDDVPMVCAFCEKTPVQTEGMVASRRAMICHDCVRYLNELIATQEGEP